MAIGSTLQQITHHFGKREPYEVTQRADTDFVQDSGLVQSSREVWDHRVKDGGNHQLDTLATREVVFKNDLIVRQDLKTDQLTVSHKAENGAEQVLATYPQAKLELPSVSHPGPCYDYDGALVEPGKQPDPTVKITHGNVTETINLEGAIQLSQCCPGQTALTDTFNLAPDGKVKGELVQAVPENTSFENALDNHDENAAASGCNGFYGDDVGNHYYFHNVEGTLTGDGTIAIQTQGGPLQAVVTPQQLGNPQPSAPMPLGDSWYARYDFGHDGEPQQTSCPDGLGFGDEFIIKDVMEKQRAAQQAAG